MTECSIIHRPQRGPRHFELRRAPNVKRLATVPGAADFEVDGRPESNLLPELRWYLEHFLEYPFSPETEHAERVLEALEAWGRASYQSLFADFDRDPVPERLRISSDDPRILSWPWEVLHHPEAGPLGRVTRVERCLENASTRAPFSPKLPTDQVRILLVTSRSENDVGYRSVSRPLVDAAHQQRLPVRIHLLRPPTLDQLRRHLIDHPDTYHVLHFDGHGTYEPIFRETPEGHLFFEDPSGRMDPVPGRALAEILKDHPIPAVVLNACQSATVDENAESGFASVATSLLTAGTRGVVAMSYSLNVSGAQLFLQAFYRCLFKTGNLSEAVVAGRLKMAANPQRVCARGRFPLEDWLVPVFYQQDEVHLAFDPLSHDQKKNPEPQPSDAIGRDDALFYLERALRRPEPAIVIQGMGGIGKTTLARSFLEWLRDTEGLGEGCIWLNFHGVASAHDVLHRIAEALPEAFVGPLTVEQKIHRLAERLRDQRFIIVWDHFEIVASSRAAALRSALSATDRGDLLHLLRALHGGQTKVVVTSRSRESWLGAARSIISLGGLQGEDRWLYCERLLGEICLDPPRDLAFSQLIDTLGGHPLAMRAILPRLAQESAGALIEALSSSSETLGQPDDTDYRQLFSTLHFVEQDLPNRLLPLLMPLALHTWFADADYLEAMARQAGFDSPRDSIDSLFEALVPAGLVRGVGDRIYELHPILTDFLRSNFVPQMEVAEQQRWARAFVEVMGSLIDQTAHAALDQQHGIFRLHRANFTKALSEAERAKLLEYQIALLQGLGVYAFHTGDQTESRAHLDRLLALHEAFSDEKDKVPVYHQLGTLTEIEGDFAAAEEWTRKALIVCESHGLEQGVAAACHQLGLIAKRQRDFSTAAEWYRRSYEIERKRGRGPELAMVCHELGGVAEEDRDFKAAEDWFRQAARIFEDTGNEGQAAQTWHHLGNLAEAQRHFEKAEGWYLKSAAVNKKLGHELGVGKAYHQLSQVAQGRDDLDAAESWCRQSLAIFESLEDSAGVAAAKLQFGRIAEQRNDLELAHSWLTGALEEFESLGDEHGAANVLHYFGRLAEKRQDFERAEAWCRKSLAIEENDANPKGSAQNYHQLAVIAVHRQRFFEAGQWLIRSIEAFYRCQDEEFARLAEQNFRRVYERISEAEKECLHAFWLECGLP